MRPTPLRLALAALVASAALSAQCAILPTTFANNNGQSGNMFDIVAVNAVTIQTFDVNVGPGTWNVEVYYLTAGGSWNGNQGNAGAWTLVGSAPITSTAIGVPTPVPFPIGVTIPSGATQAFYVTLSTGGTMYYTNGTAVNAVYAQDANIQFLEGIGLAYPFGTNFTPRIWNGNIGYDLVGSISPYQVNQPGASLDFDGSTNTPCLPMIVQRCPGALTTLNVSSTSTMGWEALITVNAALVPFPQSGIVTPSLQVVNVDVLHPSFFFLNGFTFPPFAPITAPLFVPAGVNEIDIQVAVIDAANPDGLSLSAAAALQPNVAAGTLPGPAGDDTFVTVNLAAPIGCGTPGSFTFFGTAYSSMQVISNGRVMFGTANTAFTPTTAQALTDSPFVGYWTDLNPAAGGSISISSPGNGLVRVDWNAVTYFAQTTNATFGILFDNTIGAITIDGLSGIGPGTAMAFLGVSAGNTGATDPGSMVFPPAGGVIAAPPNLGMLYQFGTQGTLATGANQILLLPASGGGYDAFTF